MASEKKMQGLKVDFWRLNGNGKVAVGSQKSYFSVVDFLFQFASLACLRFLSCPHSLSLKFPNSKHVPSRVRGEVVVFPRSTQPTQSLTSITNHSIDITLHYITVRLNANPKEHFSCICCHSLNVSVSVVVCFLQFYKSGHCKLWNYNLVSLN